MLSLWTYVIKTMWLLKFILCLVLFMWSCLILVGGAIIYIVLLIVAPPLDAFAYFYVIYHFVQIACGFVKWRGSVDPNVCLLHSKGKSYSCTHLGGARLYFANFCGVVIKHQKGGDWKGISRLNVFCVFVVNKHQNTLRGEMPFQSPPFWCLMTT